MQTTVEYVRRLRPYCILSGGHHEDPFVAAVLCANIEEETLTALKDYTRGLYSPELHYESFRFFEHSIEDDQRHGSRVVNHPAFRPAIEQTRSQLSVLRPVHIIRPDQFDKVSWIPSSSAGYGYVGKKRDNYPLARRNATRALYGFAKWRSRYRFVPDKAFARTQLSLRSHPKVRHVWGRAFHHILIEGLIGQPFIQNCMQYDTPIYIGKDIHKDMPYVILRAMQNGGTCYCIDFSKFDASVCSQLVKIAWSLLEELLVLDDFVDRLVFDFCYTLFTNTPLLMPDGRLYIVRSGVPSGSYFTQIIDSIVNLLVINMCMYDAWNMFYPVKVLGDDSLFVVPTESCTVEELTKFFDQFGLAVSDKTVITRNHDKIVFLGHNFYGSRVTRDEFTCLSLALFTEEAISSPEESALRIGSLIYDCGYNSFSLFNLYKHLLHTYNFDWDQMPQRPADVYHPYFTLFILS